MARVGCGGDAPLSSDQELAARILAFEFKVGSVATAFAKRLACEDGWAMPIAARVLLEFKRLGYRAMVSPQPVTPSEHMDQAWHLHLAFTLSYWEVLAARDSTRLVQHFSLKAGLGKATGPAASHGSLTKTR